MTLETEMESILQEVMPEVGYLYDEIDDDVRARFERYIRQGAALLNKTAGCPVDLSEPFERGLLINYCFYANARKADLFEVNYSADLASLHADYNVIEKLMNGSDEDEE